MTQHGSASDRAKIFPRPFHSQRGVHSPMRRLAPSTSGRDGFQAISTVSLPMPRRIPGSLERQDCLNKGTIVLIRRDMPPIRGANGAGHLISDTFAATVRPGPVIGGLIIIRVNERAQDHENRCGKTHECPAGRWH